MGAVDLGYDPPKMSAVVSLANVVILALIH